MPTITTKATPDALSPAYNPIWYYFDSTNKANTSFRYVVDLWIAGAATYLHRYKIAPRPVDGYCAFNCSKALQTQFALSMVPSFVDYEVKVGEEFSVPWIYDTIINRTTGTWAGYTQLSAVSNIHSYQPQDQIDITQDAPITAAQLSGLHTVVEVIDNKTIVIDVVYPGVTTNVGSVNWADGRRVVYENIVTLTDKRVFQGAIHHDAYNVYSSTRYTLATPILGYAISYHPLFKTTGWGDITRLQFMDTYWKVWAQTDDGTIYESAVNTSTTDVTYLNVGPTEIGATCPNLLLGTGPLLKSDTKWYRILLINNTPTSISQMYQFNMLPQCSNYETLVLMFKDRLGSMGSFTFRMRNEHTLSWERKSNTKSFGSQSGTNPWTYASTEAGKTIYSINQTSTYTVRTEWLTPEDSAYFLEMVGQPEVYMIKHGVTVPVVISTGSLKEGQRPQDKNIKYEISFMIANNDIINI